MAEESTRKSLVTGSKKRLLSRSEQQKPDEVEKDNNRDWSLKRGIETPIRRDLYLRVDVGRPEKMKDECYKGDYLQRPFFRLSLS